MKIDNEATRRIRTVIPPESEGVRLDQYLASRFTYRSRTAWQELICAGTLALNGRATRPSRLLHVGDVLEFRLPDLDEPDVDPAYEVLYETDRILAVTKSGDIPIHPSGRYFRNTLSMVLRGQFGGIYPVNRLDRETSGVVLFAKDARAAALLASLFSERMVQKRYLTWVHGNFPESLCARGWLFPHPDSPVRKKRAFSFDPPPGSRSAAEPCETEFRLVWNSGSVSCVECLPHTGRLHQIRATLCSLGFPLLGDKIYGPDDALYLRWIENCLHPEDEALLFPGRQALHAESLRFRSPFEERDCFIRAPLPPDLIRLKDCISGCIVPHGETADNSASEQTLRKGIPAQCPIKTTPSPRS